MILNTGHWPLNGDADTMISGARRSRFFSNYGMLGVLLLLCLFFSLVTVKDQYPTGAEGARQLAAKLVETKKGAGTLIVAKDIADHDSFVEELTARLKDGGIKVVGTIRGAPPAIRQGLDAAARSDAVPDVVLVIR